MCLFHNFSGERTFGVLTKIDLMDKGTDAVDVSLRIASQIGAFRVLFGYFSEMGCVSG